MKRTPLRRKTPLTRRGQLSSKPGVRLRQARLKSVSTKRQSQQARYLDERASFLAQHPVCQCCGRADSTDCHHKAKKDGARLTDWENIVALCRPCHQWIHANPKQAYQRGWLVRVNRNLREEELI